MNYTNLIKLFINQFIFVY